jgi:hypothetical protein
VLGLLCAVLVRDVCPSPLLRVGVELASAGSAHRAHGSSVGSNHGNVVEKTSRPNKKTVTDKTIDLYLHLCLKANPGILLYASEVACTAVLLAYWPTRLQQSRIRGKSDHLRPVIAACRYMKCYRVLLLCSTVMLAFSLRSPAASATCTCTRPMHALAM